MDILEPVDYLVEEGLRLRLGYPLVLSEVVQKVPARGVLHHEAD